MNRRDAAWMPWLDAPLARAIAATGHHAWLIAGPAGVGQFELASALAEAWLCEDESLPPAERPCGRCAACRLLAAGNHPDLLLLLPQALRESLGRSGKGEGGEGGDDSGPGEGAGASKKKPSKDVRVDEIRAATAFAATTSARGRPKVVVVHPAERMNPIAANAFLKTLEEPPGDSRFVLSTGDADALLPTIRSRCQAFALALPPSAEAAAWLGGQGVGGAPGDAETLLAGAGGRPSEALARARDGLDAATWRAIPRQVAAGETRALEAWPLPRVIDALQRLCDDTARVAAGLAPRAFAVGSVPGGADVGRLVAWSRELAAAALTAEHPWYAPLAVDALVRRGREALQTSRSAPARRGN